MGWLLTEYILGCHQDEIGLKYNFEYLKNLNNGPNLMERHSRSEMRGYINGKYTNQTHDSNE